MKTLIAAVAFVGLLATPVLAQEAEQSKLLVRPADVNHGARTNATRIYTNPAHKVYAPNGEYIGADPDAFIRNSMWFDDAMIGAD